MLKRFIKTFSAFMAVIMMASALSVITVSANSLGDDISENLIIHYDFEGATPTEALNDKAPAGSVLDDLGIYFDKKLYTGSTETGFILDQANGTIKNTVSIMGLGMTITEDTKKISQDSTWFIRVKMENIEDVPTADNASYRYYTLVDINGGGGRPFRLLYDRLKSELVLGMSYGDSAETTTNQTRVKYEYDFDAQEYLNIAISAASDVDAGNNPCFTVNAYVATGLPQSATDWTKLTLNESFKVGSPRNEVKRYVAVMSFATENDATGITLDDLRVYDKALSIDEIASIIPNGSFDTGAQAPVLGSILGDFSFVPFETSKNDDDEDESPKTDGTNDANGTNGTDNSQKDINEAVAEEEKSGCGSMVVGSGALIVAFGIAGMATVLRKKKQD